MKLLRPSSLRMNMPRAARAASAALVAIFLAASVVGAGPGGAARAQLPPPAPRALPAVVDPTMVIDDRGAPLEVLPTQRALPVQPATSSPGHIAHQMIQAAAAAPIGPRQLGVVYNHALQQQGYITGEVTFRMKGSLSPGADFSAALYPGLRKLLNPNIYVVVAGTPAQFVQLVRRLQARTDVQWVEPIVNYGHSIVPRPVR
jgi:hypothetical protein